MHQGLTLPAESSLSLSICWGLMAESLLLLTNRGVSGEQRGKINKLVELLSILLKSDGH